MIRIETVEPKPEEGKFIGHCPEHVPLIVDSIRWDLLDVGRNMSDDAQLNRLGAFTNDIVVLFRANGIVAYNFTQKCPVPTRDLDKILFKTAPHTTITIKGN